MADQRQGRAREARSASDQQAGVVQVQYELSQLVEGANRAQSDNAHLESMLLHARALIEFLLGRGQRNLGRGRRNARDMSPDDFAPGWTPPDSPSVARLANHLPDIDRHLAHLSWERVDWQAKHGAKFWHYPQLVEDVVTVFSSFADHAERTDALSAQVLVAAVQVARMKAHARREGTNIGAQTASNSQGRQLPTKFT